MRLYSSIFTDSYFCTFYSGWNSQGLAYIFSLPFLLFRIPKSSPRFENQPTSTLCNLPSSEFLGYAEVVKRLRVCGGLHTGLCQISVVSRSFLYVWMSMWNVSMPKNLTFMLSGFKEWTCSYFQESTFLQNLGVVSNGCLCENLRVCGISHVLFCLLGER